MLMIGGVRVNQKNLIIRIMKKLDNKNRILLPKIILENIKSNEFYIELFNDGSIKLIPISERK